MTNSSPFAPDPSDSDRSSQGSFLSTHRAATVWAREFGSLVAESLDRVHAEHAPKSPTAPVIRRSPDRCIVQLGPVALTVARLKSSADAVGEGQLLIIVWRGAVAPAPARLPEHVAFGASKQAAVALWEESYIPVATSPDDWSWAPTAKGQSQSTSALAKGCFERLSAAYADASPTHTPPSTADKD